MGENWNVDCLLCMEIVWLLVIDRGLIAMAPRSYSEMDRVLDETLFGMERITSV